MDKKIASFAGAVSSLALMHAADAAPAQSVADIANPRSYAELLQPIPNAAALLKEVDMADAARARTQNSNVQLAQFWGGWGGDYGYHHHHHHHHHHHYYGGGYYGGPYYRYHHHHHHHYRYPNYYYPYYYPY